MVLKKEIRKFYYKKAVRNNRQNKNFVRFSQAKTVGILYRADNAEMKKLAHKLVEILQGNKKDAQSFGFINTKKFKEDLRIRYGYEYFNRSHLNWWGLPAHSNIQSFSEKEFDYLINLDTKTLLLSLIAANSNAHCKITTSKTLFDDAYDFIIDVSEGEFIDRLLHYLQKIG